MMFFKRSPRDCGKTREIPMDEKANVSLLVEEYSKMWGSHKPPQAHMAEHAVRDSSFFAMNRESETLRMLLGGKRLTDLGAGYPVPAAVFAMHYGASEYVGVDRYQDYSGSGLWALKDVRLVECDMLEHLSGEPDMSTNIMMNAIDRAVLVGPSRTIEAAYATLLLRNIARVVPPGGIAFGIMSPILEGLSDYGLIRMERTDVAHVTSVEALFRKPL